MRTKRNRKILFTLLALAFAIGARAQLSVQTVVVPPYSPYLSDYYGYSNKVAVTIVNPTAQTYQVRLLGQISGNSIQIAVKQSFKPQNAIVVMPGVTTLKGKQLEPYFSESALTFSGITKQEVLLGNGLPEGNYQLCFRAAEYNGAQFLSPPNQGCANLFITHFETPKLTTPTCNSDVEAKNPQNQLFNWTVPAGVMPQDVEYELTVVEVYPANLNPNQALESATDPPFFRKTVPFNTYLYQLADPPLETGKTYAWRVRAKARAGKQLNFKNNGYSPACSFNYKPKAQQQNPDPPEDEGDCAGNCLEEAPQNQNAIQVKVGDTVFVGKFSMILSQLNGESGKGRIHIPFLKATIAVTFSNLKVNSDRRAFGNTVVTAEIGQGNLYDQALANDPNGDFSIAAQKLDAITNYINQGQKLVSKFKPDMQAVPVPFAQDQNGFNWNILGLIFTPTQAYMNAVVGLELADAFENNWVDLGMKGICIRPNGYGSLPTIQLKTDKTAALSAHADLVLFGNNSTYAKINCNGVEQIHVAGAFRISRNKLLPHDGNKIIGGQDRVQAEFEMDLNSGGDWLTEASISPGFFVLPEARDVILKAQTVVLDLSQTKNSNGFALHPQHPRKASDKSWQGLYLKEVQATLPETFRQNGNPIKIAVNDLIMDKTGIWFQASVENVFSIDQGELGGWRFSMTSFGLDIRASSVHGGEMNGSLQIPISNTPVSYEALLAQGDEGLNYTFSIGTLENIQADLWLATLKLKPGSKVTLEKKNAVLTPMAVLNGSITIGFDQAPNNNTPLSNLSLNNLDFQELTVSGGNIPEIDLAFVSLNAQNGSEQHGLNKFPLNLTELAYQKNNEPGLFFGVGINLVKGVNGFNANTGLKIKGKYNPQQKRFEYQGLNLESVAINAKMGAIDLQGSIDIYQGNATYGTGFRGDISATVKVIGVAIDATLQVGKMGNSNTENASNYRYWFADISARWTTGLIVPGAPAIAFYGFSGGAYKNMERQSPEIISNASMPDVKGPSNDMTAGKSRSGITYTPKKGSAGFMAGVTLGTAGEPTAFNADLKFQVQFNTDDFGITKMVLEGNAYIMGPILDRNKKLLEVSLLIETDFEKPSFDANVTIDGGFDQSMLQVTVAASLNIHSSPDLWYVKLGYWTNEDEPWKDPKRIQVDVALDAKIVKAALNFNAYFMMGTDIGDLPKSPLKVRNMLADEGKQDINKTKPAELALGKGFAFGAGIRFNAELDFAIFYTDIEFILGGDVILSKSNLTCNGSFDYGINQWYAKGQAYAYLDVDAGIRLNMWLWKGEFSLVAFQTAAQINAELPNPYWMKGQFALEGSLFNGLIKINSKYQMELGEKCQWAAGTDLKDIPIIEEMLPEENEKKTVFTAPQAAFNFPFNETILLKDNNGKSKTVKFNLVSVVLKKGNSNIAGKYHFNNARTGITFLANETLPEKSNLTFTVVAQCKQNVKGSWKVIRTETKSVSFKTDLLPDYIDPENVIKAYPQIGQRYFLQDDNDQGNINLGMSQCYLLDKKEDAQFNYSYKLCLVNVETGNRSYLPFTCLQKDFRYQIPKLQNETVYELRFLRIASPKNAKIDTKKNTKSVYTNLKGMPVDYKPKLIGNIVLKGNQANSMKLKTPDSKPILYSNKLKLQGGQSGGDANSILVRKNKLAFEQEKQGEIEDVLFRYYFRTSKYNSSSQKYGKYQAAGFGSMVYSQVDYGYEWLTYVPFPLVRGDENMDVYDAYGYLKSNFNIYVDPLVQLKINWSNEGWYQNVNSRIYGARYKDYSSKTVDITNQLKSNRFATRNFFGRTDLLFGNRPVEAIKVWSPYTEGPIQLKNNEIMLKPKGKLSSSEISKAKSGQKLNETVGLKYVIPITDYSTGVVVLDAIQIYLKHKSWCNSDHLLKSYEKNCYSDQAYPLLKGNMLSKMAVNPYGNIPDNQKLSYQLTYGYYSNKPFQKSLNFTYKK